MSGSYTSPTPEPVASRTADLGPRFGARLIDSLIFGAVALIVTFGVVTDLSDTQGATIAGVIVTLAHFAYHALMESSSGATIGKRLLKIRVVAADGSPPSLEAAAKRNAWLLLGLIPATIGTLLSVGVAIAIAVTINNDDHRRGAHDKFADTGVMTA